MKVKLAASTYTIPISTPLLSTSPHTVQATLVPVLVLNTGIRHKSRGANSATMNVIPWDRIVLTSSPNPNSPCNVLVGNVFYYFMTVRFSSFIFFCQCTLCYPPNQLLPLWPQYIWCNWNTFKVCPRTANCCKANLKLIRFYWLQYCLLLK